MAAAVSYQKQEITPARPPKDQTTSIYLQSLDETTRSVAETLITSKKAVDNGQDFGQDFSLKTPKNRVRSRRITSRELTGKQ